ncbi:MAG: M48 family metalloprotease [Acidobacteriota bacterium]
MKRVSLLFACLLPLALTFTFPVQAQLGKLGSVLKKAKSLSDLQISEADEIALGKAVSEKIRAAYGVQQDVEAHRYITLVGLVVAQKTNRPNLPYQFIILDSNVINAFAAPGGFIHITRGALASFKDEAELAGVLGHEIAHVTEKHTLKGLQKMKGIQLAQDQTSLTSNSEVFAKIADKASEAILQGFGRAEELESDRVGVRFAAACGYTPQGLPGFLETLKAQNESSSARAGLFASHPETQERIDKLQAQIKSEKLAEQASAVLAERLHQFIKYQLEKPSDAEASVEGAKGLAGSGSKTTGTKSQTQQQAQKPEEKKKGGFSLGRLRNPFGSGEKKESGEVTGAGAGRGVGQEDPKAADSGKPKNTAVVQVTVSEADVQKFRADGNLK